MTDKKAKKEKRVHKYYDDVLNCRIRELMDENKTRTSDLAEKLSISSTAVRLWYTGYGRPEIDKIPDICDYFNVSADWLLGRSEIKSENLDIADICEKTGLSEKAAKYLVKMFRRSQDALCDDFNIGALRASEFTWFISSLIEGLEDNAEADGATKLVDNVVGYVNLRNNPKRQIPNQMGNSMVKIAIKQLKRSGAKYSIIHGEEAIDYYSVLFQRHFLEVINKIDESYASSWNRKYGTKNIVKFKDFDIFNEVGD